MTVTIERPATAAARTLPPCPTWCPGDCVGGEPEIRNGIVIPADRLHRLVLANLDLADGDSYRGTRHINVQLVVERYDTVDPDEPATETRLTFVIDGHSRPVPTTDQAAVLIAALGRGAGLLAGIRDAFPPAALEAVA